MTYAGWMAGETQGGARRPGQISGNPRLSTSDIEGVSPFGEDFLDEADAAAARAKLALGTAAVANTGDFQPVGTVVAYAGTIPAAASLLTVDATGGPVTVALPAASSAANREITVKKIDASANAVTLDGDGAETIDGTATQPLATQWESLTVKSNGTAWLIL